MMRKRYLPAMRTCQSCYHTHTLPLDHHNSAAKSVYLMAGVGQGLTVVVAWPESARVEETTVARPTRIEEVFMMIMIAQMRFTLEY